MKKTMLLIVFLIIGAILTQGFQCASPELTTAKIAKRNKDWEKVKSSLEREIEKNSTNGETWLLLVEAYQNLKQVEEAVATLTKGERYITDEELKKGIPFIKYQLSVECFNEGIEHFNKYVNQKKESEFLSTIKCFESGLKIRPSNPDYYRLIGTAYELKGDTVNSIANFTKYTNMLKNEIDFASEKTVSLNMTRTDAITSLGKSVESKGIKSCPECDSVIVDGYNYKSKEVTAYFVDDKKGNMTLMGWRFDLPKDLFYLEKLQPFKLYTGPFFSLAATYFDKKEYEKALENIRAITILEPSNPDANNALVQIYDLQGKKDESIKYISDLVTKFPNNKNYLAQYGNILFQLEKYDEAIKQYQYALKIDPEFGDVLRNLAASYKNKVSQIQKSQQEQMDKDPKYKIDPNEWLPILKSSCEYFERARKTQKYLYDFEVMGELAEIYWVTGDKPKHTTIVSELRSLENSIDDAKKLQYYQVLLKIYDKMEDATKELDYIQEKIKSLGN